MTIRWDPAKMAAARARGRAKALATTATREPRRETPGPYRGERLAIACAMWEDRFKLHDIRRVTGLAPSVVSELMGAVGLPHRPRGFPPGAARQHQPTVAAVLQALDAPNTLPIHVATKLQISIVAVIAIQYQRAALETGGEAVRRRCATCLATFTGPTCPNGHEDAAPP